MGVEAYHISGRLHLELSVLEDGGRQKSNQASIFIQKWEQTRSRRRQWWWWGGGSYRRQWWGGSYRRQRGGCLTLWRGLFCYLDQEQDLIF